MGKIGFKNILGKNNSTLGLIQSLIGDSQSGICIEDTSGKIWLDFGQPDPNFKFEVLCENECIGWVKGDEKGKIIAGLLEQMLRSETEKKKLGSEVLHLYQEINLIFNFSEKLAKTIGAKAISEITLNEACHVIDSQYGVVILWDEEKKALVVEASEGNNFFDQEKINNHLSLLLKIILTGQSEIVSDINPIAEAGIISADINSIIYSALKVKHRIMGAIILANIEPDKYTAASLKLLTTLALQSSSAIESSLLYEKNIQEAKEKEAAMRKIFDASEKFVPYQFIKSLGHEAITEVKLGDQVEKIVTVLFTDIRNYTSLSEQLTPEETFGFICLFNARMGPIIKKHNGFINQYLGDSIMAIFPLNADGALRAAIEMQKEVAELSMDLQKKTNQQIQIGIGMHTGPLIMGITGDLDRMDACTISDTVNTASRIESLTKHYKAPILLTGASVEEISDKGEFMLRNLGLVQLKGKNQSINLYECFDCDSPKDIQHKNETLSIFNNGVSFYYNKSFADAIGAFSEVLRHNPSDPTALFFLNHTQKMIASGSHETKTGIVEMKEK
ncbi:MAG: adenylate/guanylate cyclase domain-containing protein [Ginsengibacter sp.]